MGEVSPAPAALSGIFDNVLAPYGVTLNVGRGFDGWSSVHEAAQRLGDGDTILYFGDFDPSGEDMVRSLRDRLALLGSRPEIVKCALTYDDVRNYSLPPDRTKKADTRRAAFVAKYGDITSSLMLCRSTFCASASSPRSSAAWT